MQGCVTICVGDVEVCSIANQFLYNPGVSLMYGNDQWSLSSVCERIDVTAWLESKKISINNKAKTSVSLFIQNHDICKFMLRTHNFDKSVVFEVLLNFIIVFFKK